MKYVIFVFLFNNEDDNDPKVVRKIFTTSDEAESFAINNFPSMDRQLVFMELDNEKTDTEIFESLNQMLQENTRVTERLH